MQRHLQPELLDSLAPDHPDALHNRRDLRIINRVLGNYRWFARTLPPLVHQREPILEVGAGTGELSVHLANGGIVADGLDLWPAPAHWPAARQWHQTDLLTFSGYENYPVVIGNFIFHQFTTTQLAGLGAKLRASARVIVANEPMRRRSSQVLFAAIAPLLGANHVSMHDAHVSVAAGFIGNELPQLLGLQSPEWHCECHTTRLGTYRMTARRS